MVESFGPPVSGWVSGVSRLVTAPHEIRKAFSLSLRRTERYDPCALGASSSAD